MNTDKTKIVVFRKRGGLKDDESWTYSGSPLEVVNDFNYLGTVFNYTGTFALNQEMLIGKGLKALNCLLYDTIRYDTLLMHKAIMAHEHINKYKYNIVQYRIARYTKHNTVAIQ